MMYFMKVHENKFNNSTCFTLSFFEWIIFHVSKKIFKMFSCIIGGKILTRKISYERALLRIIMSFFNEKCDDKYKNY